MSLRSIYSTIPAWVLFRTSGNVPRDPEDPKAIRAGYIYNQFDYWYETVEGYSVRILAYSSGKLLALSDITNLWFTRYGSTYLLGPWEIRLPISLPSWTMRILLRGWRG
jgi:hypothetical protein